MTAITYGYVTALRNTISAVFIEIMQSVEYSRANAVTSAALIAAEPLIVRHDGTLKTRDRKMRDWKMRHQTAMVENAGLENAGNVVWNDTI